MASLRLLVFFRKGAGTDHVHVANMQFAASKKKEWRQVNEKFLELKRDIIIGIVEKAKETSSGSYWYA